MKQKGRLQFFNRAWVDSAMGSNLDIYVKKWLTDQLIHEYSYRWLEDGQVVYLPKSR
jgi:hypothetical protein